MLQTLSIIKIEQCAKPLPSENSNAERNGIYLFSFFNNVEIVKSVDEIIQKAKVVLPRRLRSFRYREFKDDRRGFNATTKENYADIATFIGRTIGDLKDDNYFNYDSFEYIGSNIGQNPALFMRGDMITIWTGYTVDDPAQEKGKTIKLAQQFHGYISGVSAQENIQLDCEDFMWYLKQLRIPNKHYNTDSNLTGKIKVTYPGLGFDFLEYSGDNNAVLEDLSKDTNLAPHTYDSTNIIGILLDSLNRSINDKELLNRRIIPLIYNEDTDELGNKIYTPNIVLAYNYIATFGNINIENNATVFTLLETIKNKFSQSIYFFQMSPNVNLTLTSTGEISPDTNKSIRMPSYSIKGEINFTSYPCNYLNLGFDQYLNTELYTPRSIPFYLNGPQGNIINSNLAWKRKEDFLVGATVKSWKLAHEEGANQVTVAQAPKKKIKSSNIHVGDYGGMELTYFYSKDIDIDPDGNPTPKSKKAMEDFGNNQLKKIHYTGYYGSFTTFGYPYCNLGDIAKITDPLYPERSGFYKIKKIIYKGNSTIGYQQEIFLGENINEIN